MTLTNKLKEKLKTYFQNSTGILWNNDQQLSNTPVGFVNIYKIEFNKSNVIKSRFDLSNSIVSIELLITFSNISRDACDETVLNQLDNLLFAVTELSKNGVPNDTNDLYHRQPTLFKGIAPIQIRKELEQLSTGNQSDPSDQLWKGYGYMLLELRL